MDDYFVTNNKKFLHGFFKKCPKLHQFSEIKKTEFKIGSQNEWNLCEFEGFPYFIVSS